uniref:Uncharacterized protein n=1 Tax=Rhizophora mucronata TaxID=61149 RepID=A0A2P2NKH5_RHIMU
MLLLIKQGVLEVAEAKIDLPERLTSGQEVLLGQILDGNLVIDPQPPESLHVLTSVLQYVPYHVCPSRLLMPVPHRLRVPVCPLRRVQLPVVICHRSSLILGKTISENIKIKKKCKTRLRFNYVRHKIIR